MSIEPEFMPPETASLLEPGSPAEPPPAAPAWKPRRIPNLGHTILFLMVVLVVLFLTEIAIFTVAAGFHLFHGETIPQLLRDPRLLIPCMAVSYILAAILSWALFTNLWREPFPAGIHWNSHFVRRRLPFLLLLGIALSLSVQLLSNYLPIPKTLPIDEFFRTRADIWLVAIFGTFIAPPFEELAFRGFMLPSLATAWDWALHRGSRDAVPSFPGGFAARDAGRDPRWSSGALIFSCILTSIVFAMLHADQLAHSWVPLSILFAVSILLCLVRLRSHSLAASSFVHAAYNGTIFVIVFVATDGFRHLEKINQ